MEIKTAIKQAKENNQKAFNYLLDTFWDDVYGFQLKRIQNENDAEDVTIQTFSRAFDKIETFDDKKAYHILDDSPSAEDILITEQHLAKLLLDIKKLKPHYQEIINLRYFQELSYKEISDQLNEPMSNIKVKLLRAKKLLSEIIKEK